MRDDPGRSFELSRRGVLGGLVTMGAASAAAGAGTVALFSDEETSTNNTVQAGTLDLTVNGSGSNAVIDVSNVVPEETGRDSTTLTNAGSLPGYLTFGITGFRTPENGVNDPESDAPQETDPLGPDAGGSHTGELAQNLEIRAKLVVDGSDRYVIGHEPVDGDDGYVLAAAIRLGPYDLGGLELSSGQSIEFVTDYRVFNAGNEIQSDSVEIEAGFALTQEPGQITLPETTEVDASAVGRDADTNDAGVRFDYTNSLGQEATVTAVHIQPEDTDLTLVSDRVGGTSYDEFTYDSDVHVETPSAGTDGWVDGGSGEFAVPGWVDLGDDGRTDSADREAVLPAGETATVNLYAFRNRSGNKEDMTDEPVRVTLDVTLADGTETFIPLVMTPD
ncbi:CalY family protein [Halobaculum sp. CBA1158]|uniref:TasA family protein n=1 Tax=Halobaculum sp. CBA1158 TaxID=2904243 RepID=UPI001F265F3E|nr:TasA family protein [Halobaculum sp. CBA1158]UIO99191.1 CalY family protein [Halobaculum sp. CBA1158]